MSSSRVMHSKPVASDGGGKQNFVRLVDLSRYVVRLRAEPMGKGKSLKDSPGGRRERSGENS